MSIVSSRPPNTSNSFLYGNNPVYTSGSHTTDPNNEDRYRSFIISGFGGLGFVMYKKDGTMILFPESISGDLPKLSGDYYITNKNYYGHERGDLYVGGPQILNIEGTLLTFSPGKYDIVTYMNGKYKGKHKLINDFENSLSTLIKPLSTGGKRKRQTKGRKAKKHSRRRRSVRA